MAHELRYGTAVHSSIIRANPQHNFAHTHAMLIYDSNAIYSMIPKNGCTTMRVSIAKANGIISGNSNWEWIHQNNDSFRPSFKDLALASYRFTVLRCPYSRLVSCFLDKIVKRTPDAVQFLKAAKTGVELEFLTFRRFCDEIARPAVRASNIHWRSQVDFLVYSDYDDYFCFENFSKIAAQLNARIGFAMIDARPMARHDSSHYTITHGATSYADAPITHLEAMMLNGFYPSPDCFYDDTLRALVAQAYEADFALYRREFPGMGLFEDKAKAGPCVAAV